MKKTAKKKVSARKKPAKKVARPSRTGNTKVEHKGRIRPLGDRVLIKEVTKEEGETTASGIIIPVSEERNSDFKRGVVVAVGPGKYDDGVLVPLGVKIGDKVLFNWGDKVKIDGEEYSLVKESEISAIVN